MCGICVVSGAGPKHGQSLLLKALSAIEHRGEPAHRYEVGAVDDASVTFGTHRLAIVAPVLGGQPMTSPGGSVHGVYNGELFNADSLRLRLRGEGVEVGPAGSDTEVVFSALEHWGADAATSLFDWEGAYIAVDERTRELIYARDPIGVKPLYEMTLTAGETVLASEIKALLPLDDEATISPVGPGTVMRRPLSGGSPSGTAYWSVDSHHDERDRREAESLAVEMRRLLAASTASRVPEDGCAVALSGGIDSAAVLRLAVECSDAVTAYTLAIPGSPDLPHAEALCRELGIPLVKVVGRSSEKLVDQVPPTVYELETWEWHVVSHSVAMQALAAAIAADGHKVVLSGEGADELLCGYDATPGLSRGEERRLRLRNLPRTNCRRLDRIGMAHTLEFRVPFLAREVVELGLSLPIELLDRDGTRKWLLRRAFARLLPASIRDRPKLSLARGAGYSHLPRSASGGLCPQPCAGDEWRALPRFPAEARYLDHFLACGYARAPYLRSRTI